MFIISILIILLSLASARAANYSPSFRLLSTSTFLIGDRLFYTGGGTTTDLFYLELGQGPFQLTDPPFHLVQNDLPSLYAFIVGGTTVIDQTAFIYTTNKEVNNQSFTICP